MSGRIRRCPVDATYTLSPLCPSCGGPTRTAHPARFSCGDGRGRYRRLSRGWTNGRDRGSLAERGARSG